MSKSVAAAAEATNTKLDSLAEQLAGLASWMKSMDASVADLSATTTTLKLHAEDAAARLGIIESRPPPQPPAPAQLPTTPLQGAAAARRSDGHGNDNSTRGYNHEASVSRRFPPDNGTIIITDPYTAYNEEDSYDRPRNHTRYTSTPKMDFPKFDGTDPTIWRDNCEMYFEIYGISDMMKILTIRRLENVEAYTEKFNQLKHQILLHDPSTSEVFFVERFIAGLADELRAVVLLHLPEDVDTASLLAQLQETEQENIRQQQQQHSSSSSRTNYRTFHNTDKPKHSSRGDEQKKPEAPHWDAKLEALRAFRKSRGECFTCGEKWSRTHKCPTQVALHILEELLDALPPDPDSGLDDEASSGDELMCADIAAIVGSTPARRRTIRLHGHVGEHEVLILVDSGSGASFIDTRLVDKLHVSPQPCEPSQFVIANGDTMVSDKMLPNLAWRTQGHTFQQDMKILPLGCYDIIMGADWLEEFSPMWVHWRNRRMRFQHRVQRITLQGIQDEHTPGRQITARQLQGLLRRGAVAECVEVQPVHQHGSLHTLETATGEGEHPVIAPVLTAFADLFVPAAGLPPRRQHDHRIPLVPGAQLVNVRPYRYEPHQKNEIERQIHLMLQQVDELLDELAGARWFTKLDLSSGYHQLRVAEGDEYKTAFRTHQGMYEFLVMPFGLTNAPATFQSVMNSVFEKVLRKGVLVFMDDILVYTTTVEQHAKQLTEVFQVLRDQQLTLQRSKCSFAKQNLEYLGHVIGINGVATDSSKITAVKDWPRPKNLKELRRFLGLTGYYRKFIKQYGLISKPLTQVMRKGEVYQWTLVTEEAFQALKRALAQAPVLALPDFSQHFVVETDACQSGVGAVLMQQGHPVAYLSKALSPRNQALSTYEKECISILMAVEKWRSYLQHKEFVIRTYQKSLLYLTEQRLGTGMQHKAFVKLMGLQYTIQYKKGITNAAADVLSRCQHSSELLAISAVVPSWLDKLVIGYNDDASTKKLWTELSLSGTNAEGFELRDGVIRKKGRVWVGGNSLAQQHILQALHDSGIGRHSGTLATYQRIKKLFDWPNLKQSVQDFVQRYDTCQRAKAEHTKLPGLLQPLPVPPSAWHTISLDFIEGLPKSNGHDVIPFVVDKLTKYGHFIPLKHPYTTLQVAQAFVDNIYKLHGLPQCIVSDRDKIFTSTLWQALFRLTDTQLMMRKGDYDCLLKKHLLRAQQRMKKQVDKHRTERSFDVGDMVFLKLQPYVQTSLAPRSSQKLAFKFFRPYKILACVGEVAYRLELPTSSKIHNAIHVSQLKRRLPSASPKKDDLALLDLDSMVLLQPEKILARRCIQRGGVKVPRVLIRWLGLPSSAISWEDEAPLHVRFSGLQAWGQASSQGGWDVTTQPKAHDKTKAQSRMAKEETTASATYLHEERRLQSN
nr:uncharacterized protein LOC127328311 [Lolium perenne]